MARAAHQRAHRAVRRAQRRLLPLRLSAFPCRLSFRRRRGHVKQRRERGEGLVHPRDVPRPERGASAVEDARAVVGEGAELVERLGAAKEVEAVREAARGRGGVGAAAVGARGVGAGEGLEGLQHAAADGLREKGGRFSFVGRTGIWYRGSRHE